MRVALDLSSLLGSRLSGVGVYVGQLAQALSKRSDLELEGVWPLNRFLKRSWINRHAPNVRSAPWIPAWSQSRFDLFHGPDFKLPRERGLRRVVTIHDLAFLQPGMTSPDFAEKALKKVEHSLLAAEPDAVIAVSEFTRLEILERFPELNGRVFTVHHGADHFSRASEVKRSTVSLDRPYFLFVGNLEARKNVIRLVEAFSSFCAKNSDHRLVLVGKPGYGYESIIQAVSDSGVNSRIEIRGYVDHEALASLYLGATAFVYPSIHEGFGFPILEAMSFGTPVLTSKGSATAEVSGDAAASLADPYSVEEIADRLKIIADAGAEQRASWSVHGQARANQFKWAECGRRTSLIYRFAISRP